MAQEDDEEDLVFNVEEVQKIVRDNIELCLGGNAYSHSRTPQWISIITDKTLSRLNKLNRPFKYITFILTNSADDCDPEEWDGAPHCSCLLLGYSHRRHMHSSMGK